MSILTMLSNLDWKLEPNNISFFIGFLFFCLYFFMYIDKRRMFAITSGKEMNEVRNYIQYFFILLIGIVLMGFLKEAFCFFSGGLLLFMSIEWWDKRKIYLNYLKE